VNLTELESALDAAGVPERYYSFTSDGYGEVYRIAPIHDLLGDAWEVYYSERGNKNRLLIFRSEAEACDEFLRWILGDSTLRRAASPSPVAKQQ
jgi:hypothetical protein